MTIRPKDRIALGGVLVVALVAAFYLLALAPAHRHATRLESAISSQASALTSAENAFATGKAAETTSEREAGDLAALRRAVPSTSDIPGLLRILYRNATAVKVDMQSITLGGSASSAASTTGGSSAGPGTSTGAADTASGSATNSVPLTLTFAGGYRALNALVRRLDGLVVVTKNHVTANGPLLTISNVALTKSKDLTVQLTADIYQRSATTSAASTTGGTS